MTLVRGSLVALLCMPVFVVGCGAEPGNGGDGVTSGTPGDMLDQTADVGPSEKELQLAANVVRQYMQLRDLKDPVTALQLFDLRDAFELVGFKREDAPQFYTLADGRSVLPDCIDVHDDTIDFNECAAGAAALDGHLKLNFTTLDVLLDLSADIKGYSAGATLFGALSVTDGAADASIGLGAHFGSLNASMELALDGIEIADCGPTIGSITLSISLGDSTLNKTLPFNGCG